jgi:3-dehydroquinate dehydratase/shikimate dehydrogenase
VPVIATLRLPADGGRFEGSAGERFAILSEVLTHPFWAVDIEETSPDEGIDAQARAAGIRIIRSFHDFTGTPEELAERLGSLARQPDEIVKGAVTPRSWADLLSLFQAGASLGNRDKILLGMGETGFPSRVLSARLGSLLTYTSPAEGTKAAPGQTDPETLCGRYRFKKLTAASPVYGIIGNPVSHSRSPEIHNRWLGERKLDGVYLPFPVNDPADFFRFAENLPVSGFSVTIPHKETVIPLLDSADDAVQRIGACNTVYRRTDRWLGTNTDAAGFIAPLLSLLERKDLSGLGVTVIGAGGAARAVVYALKEAGAGVLILNRSRDRGISLAEEFGCRFAPLEDSSAGEVTKYSDIIVQTTSAGMEGPVDPLAFYPLSGKEIVYDIIYSPPVTPLMERATRAGCRVLGGYPMLENQARRQFGLFTGEGM